VEKATPAWNRGLLETDKTKENRSYLRSSHRDEKRALSADMKRALHSRRRTGVVHDYLSRRRRNAAFEAVAQEEKGGEKLLYRPRRRARKGGKELGSEKEKN